jgi:uracil-DNA glycosylase family 4
MDSRRLNYLRALDIDVWERRDLAPAAEPLLSPAEVITAPGVASTPVRSFRAQPMSESVSPTARVIEPAPTPAAHAPVMARDLPDVSHLGWNELRETVRVCTLCDLHKTRTQPVFGVGDPAARWMVIGEAPGADEDRQGEPFVGKAGQLLNAMLRAMGLTREQIFIANILKSRPPGNRDPRADEVQACLPFLYRQIELVNPRLILCVGRIAAQTLLDTDSTIGKLRGKLHRLASGRPMVVTYHPAYLLRSPAEKRKSWADMVLAMQTFQQLGEA